MENKHIIGKRFKTFVGQGSAKSKFHLWLNSYSKGASIPNVFLEAHKGSGKTELANLVAKEVLDIHRANGWSAPMFAERNCSEFSSPNNFIDEIIRPLAEEKIPAVILLDEFHALNPKIQTALLSFFNPSRNSHAVMRWRDEVFTIDKSRVTFLTASTNPEKILEPLYERLTTVTLKAYTHKEISEIIKIKTKIKINQVTLEKISKVCRNSPRLAMEMLEDLERYALACGGKINCERWDEYKKVMEVLPLGLNLTEAKFIKLLEQNGESQNQVIAAMMGLDRKTVMGHVQSFPLKESLVEIIDGSRRKLTPKGREVAKLLD